MHKTTLMKLLPAHLLLSGCLQNLLDEGDALVSITATEADASATSSTGEPSTPTTSGPGVQTVTGDEHPTDPDTTDTSSTSAGSTSGEVANLSPTIEMFTTSDDYVDEAETLMLMLAASDDHAVVKVHLYLDGVAIAELTPADFPYAYDVLSAKFNGDPRIFKVVVEDAEGLTAEREADPVTMLLPQSGAEKCLFKDTVDGDVISVITALTYTPTGILAAGTRGIPGALKLTAWMLDPNSCQALPGWPKSIENWSADDGLKKLISFGAAVASDEDGNLILGGNIIVDNKPRSYVALLNSTGSLLWEKAGQVGDELTSVASATAQFKDRVFVGGARRTNDNPVRTDGAIWIIQAEGGSVFVAPPTLLRAPFTADEYDPDDINSRSEWVRALVIQPGTGYALAVGEREFKTDPVDIFSRSFAVRIEPLGGIVGTPWTSSADASFLHDAMRSIAVCGDGFIAGGWTRDELPEAEPVPMMLWFDAAGKATDHRSDPQLTATRTHGIACDREGKIISASTRMSGATDAEVFAVLDHKGPLTSYESGAPGDDAAAAVARDRLGFCGWGGYRTANAKPYAFVRVHNP